jgi:hypothetical protein
MIRERLLVQTMFPETNVVFGTSFLVISLDLKLDYK